ncbi:MAG: hypothetical protein GY772_19445 [bacterium]|nr:hypothetical protein [bacterium]
METLLASVPPIGTSAKLAHWLGLGCGSSACLAGGGEFRHWDPHASLDALEGACLAGGGEMRHCDPHASLEALEGGTCAAGQLPGWAAPRGWVGLGCGASLLESLALKRTAITRVRRTGRGAHAGRAESGVREGRAKGLR